MSIYQVTVGNIGTVYDGVDHAEALSTFEEYVSQSRYAYGRASMEDVMLLCNGEPIREHRMPPPVADAVIKAVKDHAAENYNSDGWDYIVECFTDTEIDHALRRASVTTVEAAIAEFGEIARLYDERRREIDAERF